MADFRSLTIQSGVYRQIGDSDYLVTGNGLKTLSGNLEMVAAGGAVVIGDALNTSIGLSMISGSSGAIDFSASSGAFTSPTGTNTFVGNVSVGDAAHLGVGISMPASSTGNINFGNSSGAFTSPTGTSTFIGNVSIGDASHLGVGISMPASSTGNVDFSNSSGDFYAPTGDTYFNGLSTSFANAIYADGGIDLSTSGTLSIGSTNATNVYIGSATVPVFIDGDLTVNGAETVVGNTEFQNAATFLGNVTFGDNSSADRVNFVSAIGALATPDMYFVEGVNHEIYVQPSETTDANGGALEIVAGDANGAGTGGFMRIDAGAGTTDGAVVIGNVNAASIGVGHSGITTTITGNLTQATGAVSLTGNAASSFTTSAGGLTLTGGADSVWSTSAGNLDVKAAAALNLGKDSSTSVSIGHSGITTTVTGNLTQTTGAVSLTGNAASSFTTTTGGLTLTGAGDSTWSTSAGNLTVDAYTNLNLGTTAADAINLGQSGVTTTVTGNLTQTTGAVSLTGNASSSLTTSAGALTLTGAADSIWSTSAGNLAIDAAGNLNLGGTNADAINLGYTGVTTTVTGNLTQTTGAVSLTGNAASSFTTTAGNLTLGGASTIRLQTNATPADRLIISDSTIIVQNGVELGFTGTGNIDLPLQFQINNVPVTTNVTAGNLNTLTGGASADGLHTHTGGGLSVLAGENINAGAPVILADASGVAKAYHGDADGTGTRTYVVGFAPTAITAANSGTLQCAGEIAVQDAIWDVVPVAANVGYPVFLSESIGKLTLTPPSTSGSTVLRCGFVSAATNGTGNTVKMVIGLVAGVVL